MLDLIRRKRKRHKTRDGKIAIVLDRAGVDLVLDVGANVGQTGESLRRAGYAGRIVSFEPVPAAYDALLAKSRGDALWEVAPRMALGDADGEVTINVSEASDMSSALPASAALLASLPRTRVQETATAPMFRLDSVYHRFCPEDATVFLKIDTQGFERRVLDGAAETLARIRGLQVELSLLPLYQGEETYLGLLADFHRWGFEPHMIVETNFSRALGRQLQIDAVFVRPAA